MKNNNAVICLLLGVLALHMTLCSQAQTPSAPATNPTSTNVQTATAPGGKRWLLIIETSAAMQRRKDGIYDVLFSMFDSEMNGQLKPGDSIGVWSYNRDLQTGKIPSQNWTLQTRRNAAGKILEFARTESYSGPANLSAVLAPMLAVAGKSKFLTIVLITSGEGEMRGTPFDAQINEAWAAWRKEKSQRPLLTALRAQEGRITHFRVTPADFAVELPPMPSPAATTNATPVAKVKPAAIPTNPPAPAPQRTGPPPPPPAALIFSGSDTVITQNLTAASASGSNVPVSPGAASVNPGAQNRATFVDTQTTASITTQTNAVISQVTQTQAGTLPSERSSAPSHEEPMAATPPNADQSSTSAASAESQTDVTTAEEPAEARPSAFMLIGIGVAGVAAVVIVAVYFVMRRRRQKAAISSLITESADDDRR